MLRTKMRFHALYFLDKKYSILRNVDVIPCIFIVSTNTEAHRDFAARSRQLDKDESPLPRPKSYIIISPGGDH